MSKYYLRQGFYQIRRFNKKFRVYGNGSPSAGLNFGKAIVILSKKLVAPAMNTAMLENPITREGITELP